MSISVYRRDGCRLCGGNNLELALQLTPTPLADAYISGDKISEVQPTFPLDLFLCKDCGFSQLLDIVSPEDVYVEYIYETTSSLGLIEHFQKYADEVAEHIKPPANALVIDLGSNDGTLLRFFKDKGMRVLGVDPAREIAENATKSGIETMPEFFTSELADRIINEHGRAAIITANNLFANVDDLIEMTQNIRRVLSPEGVFIFESFYLADQIKNMVFDFTYHEHLSYFSVKPLEAFFRRQGMELINVKRIPTKGGSLRYTAQLLDGPRKVEPSIVELKAVEENMGIHRLQTFKAFAGKIDEAKAQLLDFLNKAKAAGKTIAGYGASATTTTLIYHFDLEDLLSFIADDYPAKQNLFSPGFHIPVLPAEAIYERKPDYIIILAWRYFEPIIKKHQLFLEKAGHFIVPLPTLKVI